MSELTKEQLDALRESIQSAEETGYKSITVQVVHLKELERGYRAYLAELEFHKQTYTQAIKGLTSKELDGEDKGYWEALAFRSTKRYSVLLNITMDEAHFRLAALQGELKGEG